MKRAAILIGVNKTGKLPLLQDAAKGARRMEEWARTQQFDTVEVFTDEGGGAVDIGSIRRAIEKIVDSGTFDQLVIYFAGHGVNIRYGEYWLLSDAPRDPQAAVNVRGSVDLASYSGISHVVLISDACRTAAQGIQAQNVSGSEIFPNDPPGGSELPVDRFFACALGRPAHEVLDPTVTAKEFQALYTDTALAALTGEEQDLYDGTGYPVAVLRPWRLKEYLSKAVPQKIKRLHLQTEIIQVPDAHICSDGNAWIARFDASKFVDVRHPRSLFSRTPPPVTAATVSTELVRSALSSSADLKYALENSSRDESTEVLSMVRSAEHVSEPFGTSHHESECGFKIRGARIVDAYSKVVRAEVIHEDDVRVWTDRPPGASVLLTLDHGRSIVLPAIPGFLAALTVEDDELIDVAYEPSSNTPRWLEFQDRARDIRALRAVAAAATKNGVFRLDGDDALAVAKQMQYAKSLDPALAIYAAYGYDGLARRDRIREMSGYMLNDLGARFFDLALLAKELKSQLIGVDLKLLSFVPLLAQGWALLPANRLALPVSLLGLERFLVPSVWTMFDDEGGQRIRHAMNQGDVR